MPCSWSVGTRTMLKLLPGLSPKPSRTCTRARSCSMSSWILPLLSGKSERVPTLSCPPQGKLPSLASSKPRALGERSWKWQEAKGERKMRESKLLYFVMFFGGKRVFPGLCRWDRLGEKWEFWFNVKESRDLRFRFFFIQDP